jgi:DNA-binding Lrp family transcriptional regulator
MNSNVGIDNIDIKIIDQLKANGRLPYKKIADIIGISEATIRRRLKRMIDEKYITKFTITLSEKGEMMYSMGCKELSGNE